MDFPCEICKNLKSFEDTKAAWSWWCISIKELVDQREYCRSCALVYDAVSAIVGVNFPFVFSRLEFTQRSIDDIGPLRIKVYPPGRQFNSTTRPIRIVKLQLYTEPGKFLMLF
jgi:hypothetical protein